MDLKTMIINMAVTMLCVVVFLLMVKYVSESDTETDEKILKPSYFIPVCVVHAIITFTILEICGDRHLIATYTITAGIYLIFSAYIDASYKYIYSVPSYVMIILNTGVMIINTVTRKTNIDVIAAYTICCVVTYMLFKLSKFGKGDYLIGTVFTGIVFIVSGNYRLTGMQMIIKFLEGLLAVLVIYVFYIIIMRLVRLIRKNKDRVYAFAPACYIASMITIILYI